MNARQEVNRLQHASLNNKIFDLQNWRLNNAFAKSSRQRQHADLIQHMFSDSLPLSNKLDQLQLTRLCKTVFLGWCVVATWTNDTKKVCDDCFKWTLTIEKYSEVHNTTEHVTKHCCGLKEQAQFFTCFNFISAKQNNYYYHYTKKYQNLIVKS